MKNKLPKRFHKIYILEQNILAKDLNLEMLETIGRVVIGLNVDKLTSSELKRDVRLFAKRYSREFIESVNDPLLKLQNSCSKFLGETLLIIKNKKDKDQIINISAVQNIYSYEIDALSKCILENKVTTDFPGLTIDNIIGNMKIIDKWKE